MQKFINIIKDFKELILIGSLTWLTIKTKKFDKWRMKKLAKKLNPYHQMECGTNKEILEVKETLKSISNQFDFLVSEIRATKAVALKSLGDTLKQKVKYFCEQGWMPQDEKNEMLSEFLTYNKSGGNGTVMYRVNTALELPVIEGGDSCEVDLQMIIDNDIANNH